VPEATRAQLRELGERVELQAQLKALPTHQLQRIENLDARTLTLSSQREQLAEQLAELPQPRRRFGREKDLHAAERSYLSSVLRAGERDLDAVLAQRNRLERELGDVPEVRAERDGLERAITQLTQEHTQARNELAERELHAPGAWVRDTFGECPDRSRPREVWEKGVRNTARYRLDHDITDPGSALGPPPEQREAQRDWERAHKAIARDQRRLGRDVGLEHDSGFGIGF
jgi:chromosome segregation ATPase